MFEHAGFQGGVGIQKIGRAFQQVVANETVDLDVENCSFVLLHQLLKKLQPQHECWPQIQETLRLCAEQCAEVIEQRLRTSHARGKHTLQKVFNGGSIPDDMAQNAFLHDLQRASVFCRFATASAIPEVFARLIAMKDRPEASRSDIIAESSVTSPKPMG